MANYSIYALAEADLTITGGTGVLSGFNQGDGSNLDGAIITLNANNWVEVFVRDDESNFNDSDGSQRLDGAQDIFGVNYADGRRVEAEYNITVTDPDGNEYTLIGFNINEPNSSFPSYGTTEGLAFIGTFPPIGVPLTVTNSAEGPGGSSTPAVTYATPPCFVDGTMIETETGPRPVDTLVAGDRVLTMDHGFQPIRVAVSSRYSGLDLLRAPSLRPVDIAPGALGCEQPRKTLRVSPQHRVLLRGWQAELHLGEPEVLVAARHLVDGHAIRQVVPAEGITYRHLLLDRHEILLSDGIWSESFFPGPEAMAGLSPSARAVIEGALAVRPLGAAARPFAGRHEVRLLARSA